MNLESLFAQFVKERQFIGNVTEKTVIWYRQSWRAFTRTVGTTEEINKRLLVEFITKLREQGLSVVSCNVYARAINSFLSWLHENEHTAEHFKIKQLREEKRIIQTFKDEHIRAILTFKPKGFYQWRLYTLLCLLIDTGIRIEEALTLRRSKIDFENLLITVMGKGNKERTIPMSVELRKVLCRWLNKNNHELVFSTKQGARLGYDNVRRDFRALAEKLGIEGVRVSPHTLRHTFARNYVRSGGNLFYLMKTLGHTTLTMSKRYVELDEQDLKEMHTRVSIMNRMR
jgi:site-specific recombinase XerD